jgi:hypothetical protein
MRNTVVSESKAQQRRSRMRTQQKRRRLQRQKLQYQRSVPVVTPSTMEQLLQQVGCLHEGSFLGNLFFFLTR